MRLFIFTNRDLASNYNLNLLLPHISDKVGKTNGPPPPVDLQLLKFFEQELPNQVLFPGWEQVQRPLTGQLMSFGELARHYGIEIVSWNDVKSPESLAFFRAAAPDLVLSVRYGKIFPNDFLRIPPHGVINLHSGLLPHYRGVLAVLRALDHGDDTVHATLHYIEDNSIDTGGVIGTGSLPVQRDKSLFWHILNLYPACTSLLVETLSGIAQGQMPARQPQNNTDAAYFTFPTETELQAFKAKGWSIAQKEEYLTFLQQYLHPSTE
jgi:methionyl-tRNA formyltransferase